MFDLFEVFVKQLLQTPNIIMFGWAETSNPSSNTNAPVPSPIFTPQTILAQAPVPDRAVACTGRNRLKDYLPVLEIIDMLAKQK